MVTPSIVLLYASLSLRLCLLLLCLDHISGKVFFITPSPKDHDRCPGEPCLTFPQFLSSFSDLTNHVSNITIEFQPGSHRLDLELTVSQTLHLELFSNSMSTKVMCNKTTASLNFVNVTFVYMCGLKFIGSCISRVESVDHFTLQDVSFEGQKKSASALELVNSNANIIRSSFISNANGSYREVLPNGQSFAWVGGAVIVNQSNVDFIECYFEANSAEIGGAVFGESSSKITIMDSRFVGNIAADVKHSTWSYCVGGALYFSEMYGSELQSKEMVSITESNFSNNSALNGGAIAVYLAKVRIDGSRFCNNTASYFGGAVVARTYDTININGSFFQFNKAYRLGGAVYVRDSHTVSIGSSSFYQNILILKTSGGSALRFYKVKATVINSKFINHDVTEFCHDNKYCRITGVLFVTDSAALFYNTNFSGNYGSLYAYNSNITFLGRTNFVNCRSAYSEGGAITIFLGRIILTGMCTFTNNTAENGGAIRAIESQVDVYGETYLNQNTARDSGGGIYLYQSDLSCEGNSTLKLKGNNATKRGGGIHAISSRTAVTQDRESTNTISLLSFIENRAKMGGGIHLEANAKLYVLKKGEINNLDNAKIVTSVVFQENSAIYGGAVYVADETNSGMCAGDVNHYDTTECFVQVLTLLYTESFLPSKAYSDQLISIKFANNYAETMRNGQEIFGGLLDRCTVSPFAEVYTVETFKMSISGVTYFTRITNINDSKSNLQLISSNPVRVCFCVDDHPNCSFEKPTIYVQKGETFRVSLAAVDQVSNIVTNATIHSWIYSTEGRLGRGQKFQKTGEGCTNLTFQVTSPHRSEKITLHTNGPCKASSISQRALDIQLKPCECPIGFEQNFSDRSRCICKCDSRLPWYVRDFSVCKASNGTLERGGNFWISFINITSTSGLSNSSGYISYEHCPFGHCKPSSLKVEINLGEVDGEDMQCAGNRSGKLCGTCQPSLSLSLGSSQCVVCPTYWPVMTITIIVAAFLAGLALVVLLLVLNLTVAVGTLNGIIFYANVMAADFNTFFPFTSPNTITVFIAWLNLEFGFVTCFFKGMDAYWKTWIELAFPMFVFILIATIIVVSKLSRKFSWLIGKKNPVATLATLVLISYGKFLRTIITTLSFVYLNFNDNKDPYEIVWLPDATVQCFSAKFILLYIVCVLILFTGTAYTIVLFLWQWLLFLPEKRIFKWVRYQRIYLFLEPYHAPYSSQHRYWTGLLLLVRTALYTVSAVNVSRDPSVNLLAVCTAVTCLFFLKANFKSVYRSHFPSVLETICYLNIAIFCITKFYILNKTDYEEHKVVAYISGSITFVQFLSVLMYHLFTEVISKTKLWKRLTVERDSLRESNCTFQGTCTLQSSKCTSSVIDGPSSHEQLKNNMGSVFSHTNDELREVLLDSK